MKRKFEDASDEESIKKELEIEGKKLLENEDKNMNNEDSENEKDDEMDSDENEENDELSDVENEKNTDFQGRNIALASAMSRILNTEIKEKPILAKAKDIEQKIEDEKLDYKARKALAAEKKRLESKDRVIPDYSTLEYEKKLRKLATRGVVKLFNAIKTAQEKSNEVQTLATNKKPKTEAAKKSFMDMLKETTSTNKEESNKNETEEKQPAWKVFHEDFGMNAKIKDWDKNESEEENESEIEDFDNEDSDGD